MAFWTSVVKSPNYITFDMAESMESRVISDYLCSTRTVTVLLLLLFWAPELFIVCVTERKRGESGSLCVYWRTLQSRDNKRQQVNGSPLSAKVTQGPGWQRSASFHNPRAAFSQTRPPGVYSAVHRLHVGGLRR